MPPTTRIPRTHASTQNRISLKGSHAKKLSRGILKRYTPISECIAGLSAQAGEQVPRLVAAAIIGENPQVSGLRLQPLSSFEAKRLAGGPMRKLFAAYYSGFAPMKGRI